jgi:nicotinamidase-related amidase
MQCRGAAVLRCVPQCSVPQRYNACVMSTVASFDISKSAVLALDCQGSIVSIYAKPPETFIDRASGVLRAARNAGVFVIHVQVGFRTGLPEVSGRNKLLSPLKSSSEHQKLFEGTPGQIHPALGPEPGDVVVTKHRVSAFAGTDLHMILRANEIETLVLFGIATSGVVLSTLLDALDRDYRLAVIAECCADLEPQLHSSLLERLFPKYADVLTADEFAHAIGCS